MRTGSSFSLDRATRRHRGNLAILALAIMTALAVVATPAASAPAEHSTSPVLTIPPPAPPSEVGTSTLTRTDHGLSATVKTTELTPGDVVTMWWVVFNNPDACEHPLPGSPCGEPDAMNMDPDGPRASGLHAAGRIVDEDGTASFGAHLREGDTSRALFGPGLGDARAAHVVLVLKAHGPKLQGMTSEMLRTFAGGCADQSDVPPGAPEELVGTPGPNECDEVQFSPHGPGE